MLSAVSGSNFYLFLSTTFIFAQFHNEEALQHCTWENADTWTIKCRNPHSIVSHHKNNHSCMCGKSHLKHLLQLHILSRFHAVAVRVFFLVICFFLLLFLLGLVGMLFHFRYYHYNYSLSDVVGFFVCILSKETPTTTAAATIYYDVHLRWLLKMCKDFVEIMHANGAHLGMSAHGRRFIKTTIVVQTNFQSRFFYFLLLLLILHFELRYEYCSWNLGTTQRKRAYQQLICVLVALFFFNLAALPSLSMACYSCLF